MRLDIHLNVGNIPLSYKQTLNGKEMFTPVSQIVEYVKAQNLTHAVILCITEDEAVSLRASLPYVKLYFLKWITNLQGSIIEDIFDGICIHSHRGQKTDGIFGNDYSAGYVTKFLKTLKKDSIVCVHTQGSAGVENKSRGLAVAKWAIKMPDIKFLIEHAGSYIMQEFYPALRIPEDRYKGAAMGFLSSAVGSEVCIAEALLVAERLPNVFVDSSIVITNMYKSQRLNASSKWAFGSDYPFEKGLYSVATQERTFARKFGYSDSKLQEVHRRGIHWLDSTAADLWEEEFNKALVTEGKAHLYQGL